MLAYKNLENRIGYKFKNKNLLEQAFIHSSYSYENKLETYQNNERLEFLGDAVLEAITSDYLFRTYEQMPEGDLTKLRASIVCESTLAQASKRINLGEFVKFGKGEELTGGRERDSILADTLESLLGAIYLDGGIDSAKSFVLLMLKSDIENLRNNFSIIDYKTFLQEYYQKFSKVTLKYKIISAVGPDHDKLFTAKLTHSDEILGIGKGKTKKEAEQNAALEALKKNNIKI